MRHYRGKFTQVDVVNEPLALLPPPGGDSVELADYVFAQLLGKDYIRIAFTNFKLVADKGAKLAKTSVMLG